MTEAAAAPLSRGLRIESIRLVQHSGEFEEYAFVDGMLNILTGVRNSSKTTTLKAIDYCLGDRGSAAEALGIVVADKYSLISTQTRINGTPYTLARHLQMGRMNKVEINGKEYPAADFSGWILRQLGWPDIQIPKALHAASATELTPLSFRNTLRHFYRNEDSWTVFANKEVEFLRRAVVSQLLGFARTRYSTKDFALAQAKRRLAEAEAVQRDVKESTQQAVTAISERLGLPVARNMQQVESARLTIRAQLDAVYAKRQELTSQIHSIRPKGTGPQMSAGYDPDLTADYAEISRRLQRAVDELSSLEELHDEHSYSAKTVTAEVGRMERLISSVGFFDALPVRLCPACEQSVDPHRDHGSDACYLCFQPVSDDLRRRRAEVEIRSLQSERADLDEVIARTSEDLAAARVACRDLQAEQARLAARINEERAAQLAPFMAALEGLAAQVAQLEQKLTALPAIEDILRRRDTAAIAVESAERALTLIGEEASIAAPVGLSPSQRCAVFADGMNTFLAPYYSNGWLDGGNITISESDLTFYVGTLPWDQALGAEAKVLFFLAYSYATLFLSADLDQECAGPGLLLLDNPYQQGIDNDVVRSALKDLATAAQLTGTQVISTQALPAPAGEAIHEIRMPTEYQPRQSSA